MRQAYYCFLLFAFSNIGRSQLEEDYRVDCHPDGNPSNSSCVLRGCLFQDSTHPSAPRCYYPPNFGYKIIGDIEETTNGFMATLNKSGPPSFVPNEYQTIKLMIDFQNEYRIRVKLAPNLPRYEVPIDVGAQIHDPGARLYALEVTEEPTFSFRIRRRSTGSILVDSSLGGLTLSDQFLQIGLKLPSFNIYGLGELEHHSLRHNMSWNSWGLFSDGRPPNGNDALYGVHPFFTAVENDGNAFAGLFLNSNAQEFVLTPAPGLVYRTIGGVIDMYFFLGPSPNELSEQYTFAIGRQPLPPYWSLGFHLSRWGYDTLDTMAAAFNRTTSLDIPIDAQWADIDVLERKLDFTYDSVNFAGLPNFIDKLHDQGFKFVIIVDPALSTGEPTGSYPAFEDGNDNQVWILNADGAPLQGRVWPQDPVLFPDFTAPKTRSWWLRSLDHYYQDVKFDGIWIDMNEPASFVAGSTDGCLNNTWNHPPYLPKFGRNELFGGTICMDANHELGLHYDTHSMYGWWEARATREALETILERRPLVLSRSTFVGSGQYAAHWLGDNWSRWTNLKYSIIGILEMNMFGIPMVGADICGFTGVATEEMCSRWQQLGAFYPFSRNHNSNISPDQDPGKWPLVAEHTRNALQIRYRLLPYLYSLFYHHAREGRTVFRPLWFEFPSDPTALGVDEQFLWGPSILFSPALKQSQTEVDIYLPNGVWYDFFTQEQLVSDGATLKKPCPLGCIPIHIRGGSIIITQVPGKNTQESRQNDFELIVAMNDNFMASGDLYWDDGEALDEDLSLGSHINYLAELNVLSSVVATNNFAFVNELSRIEILGVETQVQDVIASSAICSWNQTSALLIIECQGLQTLSDWTIQWI